METSNDPPERTTRSGQPAPKSSLTGPEVGASGLLTLTELKAASQTAVAQLALERQAARQAAVERAIDCAGIPPRFRGHSFADYVAVCAAQRRALGLARAYADNFATVRARGNCLLLLGGPGTGKTHLACAILSQVIAAGYSGRILSASDVLRLIRAADSPAARQTELDVFETLTSPDLLVLDEVGVAVGSAGECRAMLFDVLNGRYGAMRPTVLVGCLTVAELATYLGKRVVERLTELGSVTVPFTWASYRRRQAQPSPRECAAP
jgi:DNA replication protein DnaC